MEKEFTLKCGKIIFELPIKWRELSQITSQEQGNSAQIIQAKRGYLADVIDSQFDLDELNIFAMRLQIMDYYERICLRGMIALERKKPVPLHRLINMTYSAGNCYVAYGIINDEQLGKFLYENDFLWDEEFEAAAARLSHTMYEDACFGKIGRRRRERENGTYLLTGYVENNIGIEELYVPEAKNTAAFLGYADQEIKIK